MKGGAMEAFDDSAVRIGASRSLEPQLAVGELKVALGQDPLALVLFFCSAAYDLNRLAAALADRFEGVPVVGCTTAGEITPWGYSEESITAVGFAAAEFVVTVACLDGLTGSGLARVAESIVATLHGLAARGGLEP